MRLTIKNISTFLMEKGLLSAKSVVDGDYSVTQTQNRNAIFKIQIRDSASLFVKQLVSFDTQNSYFLQKDATCLWLIKNEAVFKKLSAYVPAYHGYDPEKQVLIVEYVHDTNNLEEIYQAKKELEPELLDQVAKIMASFHFKLSDKTLTNRSVQFFMRQLPWTFQFAQASGPYTSQFAQMYAGNPVTEYLKNNDVFLNSMRRYVDEYKFESLIHGDIKWVNFITKSTGPAKNLRLIDWELADVGDPLWDVAGAVQSLFTSKVIMATAPAPYTGTTTVSPEQMTQSLTEIKTLWTAYAGYRKFDSSTSAAGLLKTLRFAGMRLVQTAFEHNTTSTQLLPNTIKLLQISHSLLEGSDLLADQILKTPTNVAQIA